MSVISAPENFQRIQSHQHVLPKAQRAERRRRFLEAQKAKFVRRVEGEVDTIVGATLHSVRPPDTAAYRRQVAAQLAGLRADANRLAFERAWSRSFSGAAERTHS